MESDKFDPAVVKGFAPRDKLFATHRTKYLETDGGTQQIIRYVLLLCLTAGCCLACASGGRHRLDGQVGR